MDLQTGALAPHGPSGVGVGDDPVCVVVVEVDVELEVVDDELVVSDAEEDTADMVLLLTGGSGTNKTSPA